MLRTMITTFLLVVLASSVSGCNSQQKKQDAEFRQRVEELKKKSNAYPVNGSQSNHYIP